MAQESPLPASAVAARSGSDAGKAREASDTREARPSRRPLILAGLATAAAAGAVTYWLHARHFETTDDAQVDGNISNVSPRTSGNVLAVNVAENQPVKQGDVLAQIDPADLEIAVAQAKAQVSQAQAQLAADDPSVPITLAANQSAVASAHSDVAASNAGLSASRKEVDQLTAQLAQAEANARTAELDKQRSEKLVAQGAVSQSDYDTRLNNAVASAAAVTALQQSLGGARDRVEQQQAQLTAYQSRVVEVTSNAPRQVQTRQAVVLMRQAALDLAKAQLDQAEKNLSYAKIVAPVSGVVAKKSIAVGDHVAPGQLTIAISQVDSLWITANYRETQLERMQPGQPASVHIDAIDADLHGTVESIGGATGSRLSVLPPENASGNYVKVVQRIPVRIRLDAGQPGLDRLRIGMSAEPKVTVR
jgi:membrane fusion protein (multidrug efflux system)